MNRPFLRFIAPLLLLSALPLFASGTFHLTFDFARGEQGWAPVFTDLPPGEDVLGGNFELEWKIRPRGFLLAGTNRSDDLGMYLVRRIGGKALQPNADYQVTLRVQFASNAPSGCFGAGGAPGEAVILQLGATPNPPTRIVDAENRIRLTNREERFAAGNIANGIPCPEDGSEVPYVDLVREKTLRVRTDAAGGLWFLVGTESGFEGRTAIIYRKIEILISTPV